MKESILNYVICFTLVGILILGTFLLPQVYSYHVDSKSIGNVRYEHREEPALAWDMDMSVKDRTAIVTNLVSEEGLNLSLNLKADQIYGDELIESVRQEIWWAAECGVLPAELMEISFDETKGALSADYYLLSSSVVEYGEMALWRVQFSDAENRRISLLLDAHNHKIYYGEIVGREWGEAWMRNKERGGEGAYMSACMQYYETEYAEPVWMDYIFEIEDAGNFGWVKESENVSEPDGYRITFGFDVFWQYFWGESLFSIYGLENADDTNMIRN